MLLAQIEAFVTIAHVGSMTGAAERLYLTQPALTARMRALENELGTELLVRSRRGTRPSPAGAVFLPYAERVLQSIESGRRHLERLERGEAGELSLAAPPAVSTYVLPNILRGFNHAHPDIHLTVRTGNSEAVLELVLGEQVGLGIARALQHPEIETRSLYHEQLVLVTQPDHEFAATGRIEVAQIAETQLILFDPTSSFHEQTSAFFRGAGVVPRATLELDNIDAAKKMVELGLGVSLLPHTAVVDELEDGRLARVIMADADPVRRSIVALWRRQDGPPGGPSELFLDRVAEAVQHLPGALPAPPPA